MSTRLTTALHFLERPSSQTQARFLQSSLKAMEGLGDKPSLASAKGRKGTPAEILSAVAGGACFEAIDLYSEVSSYKQLAFGWSSSASLQPADRIGVISTAELDEAAHEALVEEVRSEAELAYSYRFSRDLMKGPTLYAFGMSAGLGYSPEEMNEAGRISSWREHLWEIAETEAQPGVRELFTWNLIRDEILDREVVGVRLEDWIASRKGHSLQRSGSVHVWRIQAAEAIAASNILRDLLIA